VSGTMIGGDEWCLWWLKVWWLEWGRRCLAQVGGA